MIDFFHNVAKRLRPLRSVAVVMAILCFLIVMGIILTSKSQREDFLLIPGVVGFLWSLSAYAFLSGFQNEPVKKDRDAGVFSRVKTRLSRFFYSLMGVVFILATMTLFFLSLRMIQIWVRDYFG
jgi:hypothetical protein